MGRRQVECRIGTSGYEYDHWRGVLYPADASRGEWFGCYAKRFDTVEINNTFYHLPERDVFDQWRRRAPKGFCYALKFSRYGSHFKKLTDPRRTIGAFLDRACLLGPHLGPILVQLPPRWRVNVGRLRQFLDVAGEVASRSDGGRWAVEFRDPTWLCDEVFDVLRRHHAALCIHDLVGHHPWVVTTEWVYLRLHGASGRPNYSPRALSAIAQRITRALDAGLGVYAYFNNDAHGYAVNNALDLRRSVSRRWEESRSGTGRRASASRSRGSL